MNLYEIVKKLVGEIEPTGSAEEDEERYKNLDNMLCLTASLLQAIKRVARDSRDISKSSKTAQEFLDYLSIKQ